MLCIELDQVFMYTFLMRIDCILIKVLNFTIINLGMSGIEKIVKLIKKGNTDKLGQLLQDPSIDINQLDPKSGKTLLQIAIQNQSKQAFELLIKSKAINLMTLSKSGQTALETAILMNSSEFVQQILRTKVNLRVKNQQGHSVMETAIKHKTSSQIISKLIFHGFNINQSVPQFGSLLNLAISCNQFQNFIILLQNPNIDIKTLDDHDNTCLLLSVAGKQGQFVQAILHKLLDMGDKMKMSEMEKQFFINACDKNGDTALHIAAKRDYQTILDILIREGSKLGIDLQSKNKQGKTYKQIHQAVTQERVKQREREQYQEKKRIEQKRAKNKQKQQQRVRLANEQEILRNAQKKKKKQDQILEAQKRKMEIEMQKNRKVWILGIVVVVVVAVMYLLFLSASQKTKSNAQQSF